MTHLLVLNGCGLRVIDCRPTRNGCFCSADLQVGTCICGKGPGPQPRRLALHAETQVAWHCRNNSSGVLICLAHSPTGRQVIINPPQEIVDGNGLLQVVNGSHLHRPHVGGHTVVPGYHQHRHPRVFMH